MKLERVSIRHYLNNSVEKPIKITNKDGGDFSIVINLKDAKDWQEKFVNIFGKIKGVPSFNINHRNNYITLSFDNENKLNEFKNLAPVNSEIKLIKIAYTNKKLQ
ncbi:hypothetical protein BB559_006267 [Furculomyces boomerangus]|uniref:Uncharacterized protein n=3 Tax=Harpellales TaxID=61421 RepID=A0A2T9Y3U5_9FUNG|nr:hypothetical protein BB559_006267 [Furculomyces boomerangus]